MFARRRRAQPRHNLLPSDFSARAKFDRRRLRRRLGLAGPASADAAAHMLNEVRRSAFPTVQREPAPQYAAIDDPAVIARSAPGRDVRAISPYIFEGFKAPSHRPAIG